MPNMVQIIKQAASEAVEAGRPVNLMLGVVTKEEPLTIQTDQQIPVTAPFLLLAQAVTDHKIKLTVTPESSESGTHTTEMAGAHAHTHSVNGTTGDSSGSVSTHAHPVNLTTDNNQQENHQHKITMNQLSFTIHNALKTGDKVLLLRMQGGQRYLVLDRVVSP